jgi:hypothetical protein
MHQCTADREAILAPGKVVWELGQLGAVLHVHAGRGHLANASTKVAAS